MSGKTTISQLADGVRSDYGKQYVFLDKWNDKQVAKWFLDNELTPNEKQYQLNRSAFTMADLEVADKITNEYEDHRSLNPFHRPEGTAGPIKMTGFKALEKLSKIPAWLHGTLSSFLDPDLKEKMLRNELDRHETSLSKSNIDPNRKNYLINHIIPDVKQKLADVHELKKIDSYQRQEALYKAAVGTNMAIKESVDDWFMDWMDNDSTIPAALKWAEEDQASFENFLYPNIMLRGFPELASSVVLTFGPSTAFRAVGALDKFKAIQNIPKLKNASAGSRIAARKIDGLSIPMLIASEGGGVYDSLVDELMAPPYNLPAEEAVSMASTGAMLYAPFAGYIERFQVGKATKYLNIGKDGIPKGMSWATSPTLNLIDKLTKNAQNKAGVKSFLELVNSNKLTKLLKDGTYNVIDLSTNSVEEAYTEVWQEMYQDIVTQAIKDGYGPDSRTAVSGLVETIKSNEGQDALNFFMPFMSNDKDISRVFYETIGGSGILGSSSKAGQSIYQKWKERGSKVENNGDHIKMTLDNGETFIVPIDESNSEVITKGLEGESSKDVKVINNKRTFENTSTLDYALAIIQQAKSDVTGMDTESANYVLDLVGKTPDKLNADDKKRFKSKLHKLILKHSLSETSEANVGQKALDLIQLDGNVSLFDDIASSEDYRENESVQEAVAFIRASAKEEFIASAKNKMLQRVRNQDKTIQDNVMKDIDEFSSKLSDADLFDKWVNEDGDIDKILLEAESKLIDAYLDQEGTPNILNRNKNTKNQSKNTVPSQTISKKNSVNIVKSALKNRSDRGAGDSVGNINQVAKKGINNAVSDIVYLVDKGDLASKTTAGNYLLEGSDKVIKGVAKKFKINVNDKQLKQNKKAVVLSILSGIKQQIDPNTTIRQKNVPVGRKTKPVITKKPTNQTKAAIEDAKALIELKKQGYDIKDKDIEKAKKILAKKPVPVGRKKPAVKQDLSLTQELDQLEAQEAKIIDEVGDFDPTGGLADILDKKLEQQDTRKPEDVFDVFDDKGDEVIRFGGETITKKEFNKLNKDAQKLKDDTDDKNCL